jgi:hypothetical protein
MPKKVVIYWTNYKEDEWFSNKIISIASTDTVDNTILLSGLDRTKDNVIRENSEKTRKTIFIDGELFNPKDLQIFWYVRDTDDFVNMILIYEEEAKIFSPEEMRKPVFKYEGNLCLREDKSMDLEITIKREFIEKDKIYYNYRLFPPVDGGINFRLEVIPSDGDSPDSLFFTNEGYSAGFHVFSKFIKSLTGQSINEHFNTSWASSFADFPDYNS